MNSKSSRAPKQTRDAAAPRKRFRIEKLEERVAPTKGGNGHHHSGSSNSGSSGSSSFY